MFLFKTAQPFFSPGPAGNFAFGETWKGFDSDAELFMYRSLFNAKIIRMYLVSSLTEILGQKSEKKKKVLHWLPRKGATRPTDLL